MPKNKDEFRYWERRTVSWRAAVDEDGNIWKVGDEEVEDIHESGLWGDYPGHEMGQDGIVSDDWQVMN